MIVRRISMTNWMPFRGAQSLDLPAGAIAVTGEHDGDGRRSNWSGKTAGAIESVLFALWGWHRKRLVDDVVTWGERECSVTVEFDGGFSVTRSRGPGGATVSISQGGVQGLMGRDAEDGIASVLAVSRDDAFASCVIRQGDMTRFVDATSAERQAIVADWLDQARWERCEARAREEARQADARAGALASAAASMKAPDQPPADDRDWAAEAAETEAELARTRERLAAFRVVDEFASLKERALAVRAALAKPVVARPSLQDEADADQALEHARAALRDAEQKRDWDGRCPVAGRSADFACPAEQEVRRRLPLLKDRDAVVARLRRDETAMARVVSDLADRVQQAGRDEGLRAGMADELARLTARGRELRAQMPDGSDPAERQRLVAAERELAALARNQVRAAADQAARREGEARRAAEHERLAGERDEWVRRADSLWGAAEAFGRNGVQAAEAESSLADLEGRANRILAGTGLDVAFATAREGLKLESCCRRCRHAYRGQRDKACPSCRTPRERSRMSALDVLVSAAGGPRQDVAECSGGARALVGVAFRLSAAALLRQTRGSPLATLLVDEPFASLDEEHRHLVARRLGEMSRIAGFDQMLVVTHDRDLADALPHRVVVRRSGGFSTLAVGP